MFSAPVILLIIIFCAFLFVVLLAQPKVLGLTIWPILMVYPHALTYGVLPLNVGFDDLYISILFVILTFRLGLPKLNFPFKAVIAFVIILFISNITGLVEAGPQIAQPVLKESIKNIIYILFTWVILITCTDEKDIRNHIISFLISVTLASLLAIADYFNVPFAGLFYIVQTDEIHWRATGSFLSPAGVGIATITPLFIALAGLSGVRKIFYKVLFGSTATIIALAIFLSSSRSGWIAVATGLLVMSFVSKNKIAMIFSIAAVFLGILLIIGTSTGQEVIEANIVKTLYSGYAGSAGRFERWTYYLTHPYLSMVLCGRGVMANRILMIDTPHSGYFDVAWSYGLGGTIFFVVVLIRLLRVSKWIYKNDNNPFCRFMGQGLFIAACSWFAVSITADPPFNAFWRYTLFFVLVMLWTRHDLLQEIGWPIPYPSRDIPVSEEYYEQEYQDMAMSSYDD